MIKLNKYVLLCFSVILISLISNGYKCSAIEKSSTPNEEEEIQVMNNKKQQIVLTPEEIDIVNQIIEDSLNDSQQLSEHAPVLRNILTNYMNDHLFTGDSIESEESIENDSHDLMNKRSSYVPRNVQKKDSQQLRRQQAARWDIGFGKRAPLGKSKQFMDALYGKRSGAPKLVRPGNFGRRQQWDIQYGRK